MLKNFSTAAICTLALCTAIPSSLLSRSRLSAPLRGPSVPRWIARSSFCVADTMTCPAPGSAAGSTAGCGCVGGAAAPPAPPAAAAAAGAPAWPLLRLRVLASLLQLARVGRRAGAGRGPPRSLARGRLRGARLLVGRRDHRPGGAPGVAVLLRSWHLLERGGDRVPGRGGQLRGLPASGGGAGGHRQRRGLLRRTRGSPAGRKYHLVPVREPVDARGGTRVQPAFVAGRGHHELRLRPGLPKRGVGLHEPAQGLVPAHAEDLRRVAPVLAGGQEVHEAVRVLRHHRPGRSLGEPGGGGSGAP
mmetsp:Transcript_74257/g.207442  ORF Transcript_74257/g.207442 Transcript_74257/m.207442 type:complete len:303 (-) Transcript_74257:9-917(-)